jgi:hypothetical protein
MFVGAKPLVVRVEEVLSGQSWLYVFETGPVWVGSSPSSSLAIARPFILEQHGIFHFDDRSVRYQDLDPRAGTTIDGDPAGGGEHILTERTHVEMGPVRLTISRRTPAEVSDPMSSPFAGRPAPTMVLAPRPDLRPAPAAEPVAWDAPTALQDIRGMTGPVDLSMSTDISLEDEDPRAYRQWGPPDERRRGRDAAKNRRRPGGRARRAGSRALVWLSALGLFAVVVGVAGLVLQYHGLPWMPPQVLARVPPWLATLFR